MTRVTKLNDTEKCQYIEGNVGDKSFTCKKCQTEYSCESFYDYFKRHRDKPNAANKLKIQIISEFFFSNYESLRVKGGK